MFDTLLSLLSRLAGLAGQRQAETEFDEEIAGHLELLTADNIRRGMPPEEARAAARRSFGGITYVKETQRELRGLPQLDIVWSDIRYAFRMLRKSPGFTIVGVLTIALGIGVNTTLFSAFNAVALKPLPVVDPSSVVRLERWFEPVSLGNIQYAFSYPEYRYFVEHARAFRSLVASSWTFHAQSGGENLSGEAVSGNYFESLGIRAVLGRTFLSEEDSAPGTRPVIVLSHTFWVRHYHSVALALGTTLKIGETTFTIVGVAPEAFPGTAVPPQVPDFWAPIAMYSTLVPGHDWRNDSADRQFVLLARLSPDVSRSRAQAQAAVLMQQFASSHPDPVRTVALTLQTPTYLGNTEDWRFLALSAALMLVVGLIWMIACANLANMMLARAASRQREIAIRLALGGTRGRIVRQLLTESTLLALAGGAAGLLFSGWAAKFLWLELERRMSGIFPGATLGISLAPDLRVFLYALLLALATGVLFGVSPALHFTRADLTIALKQDGATFGARLSRSRFRSFLVASQVTASMLLLIVAGLLVRGLLRARDTKPGFETRGLYLLNGDFGIDPLKAATKEYALLDQFQRLPQLRGAGIGSSPMMGTWTPPIYAGSLSSRTLATYASAGYLATLGVPLLRGRDVTPEESRHTAHVALVSEATARTFWPEGDPIGKHFKLDLHFSGKLEEFEVIGMVGDVHFANLSRIDPAHVYLNAPAERPEWMMVRTAGDPAAALAAIRAAAARIDPDLPRGLTTVSLEQGPLQMQRALAEMYGEFAGLLAILAVVLAGIGIYGVMSYLVNCRVKEIGVLMALGAGAGDVLRVVTLQGLRPVAAGSLLGLFGAAGLSKLLNATLVSPGSSDLLYGLPWWDPLTFLGITVFLAAVAALASAVPARRALRVDPMTALRGD